MKPQLLFVVVVGFYFPFLSNPFCLQDHGIHIQHAMADPAIQKGRPLSRFQDDGAQVLGIAHETLPHPAPNQRSGARHMRGGHGGATQGGIAVANVATDDVAALVNWYEYGLYLRIYSLSIYRRNRSFYLSIYLFLSYLVLSYLIYLILSYLI